MSSGRNSSDLSSGGRLGVVVQRLTEGLTCPICLEIAQLPVLLHTFRGCKGAQFPGKSCHAFNSTSRPPQHSAALLTQPSAGNTCPCITRRLVVSACRALHHHVPHVKHTCCSLEPARLACCKCRWDMSPLALVHALREFNTAAGSTSRAALPRCASSRLCSLPHL